MKTLISAERAKQLSDNSDPLDYLIERVNEYIIQSTKCGIYGGSLKEISNLLSGLLDKEDEPWLISKLEEAGYRMNENGDFFHW